MFSPISTQLGQLGSQYIGDTATYSGTFGIIYCLSTCVFNTLTSNKLPDGATNVTLGTIPGLAAGQVIYGNWSAIKLTSGTVIAYNIQ